MASETVLYRWRMFEFFHHHLLVMTVETQLRPLFPQHEGSSVRMWRMTIETEFSGKSRLMLHLFFKIFLFGSGMTVPAQIRNRFFQLAAALHFMAGSTFPFPIRLVVKGIQRGLGSLEPTMGVMTG